MRMMNSLMTGTAIVAWFVGAALLGCEPRQHSQTISKEHKQPRTAGRRHGVGPAAAGHAIHHAAPRMDLRPQCLMARDRAKKAGAVRPLCFEETQRKRADIKVIAVEIEPGGTRTGIRRLAQANEGAHFLIERTGSIYQVLDLGLCGAPEWGLSARPRSRADR